MAGPVDLILTKGKVITVDSAFSLAEAIAVTGERITAIGGAAEIEALAASVPDSGGVTFVPALAGLGAPHWRPDARGIFTGITQGASRAHIARAVLDGIALQLVDIMVYSAHTVAPATAIEAVALTGLAGAVGSVPAIIHALRVQPARALRSE